MVRRKTGVPVRTRCYGCFRPVSECYCDAIPSIENQTQLLIVQHSRERDHPFNTARMVRQGLTNSKLICGTNQALSKMQLPIRARSGLLYPSHDARTLSDLSPAEKPDQLVIVDGTWSQAKTMVRDIEQLAALPQYQLSPTQPGQYRIRLEPTDTSLSTVEAAVAALRELEPETQGFDQLLGAFELMVQKQLDHPNVGREHYSGGPKSGHSINIPQRMLGDAYGIVVA
jgi:DTW domain-containing protein YfiP